MASELTTLRTAMLAAKLAEHQPTPGMQVSSGITCRCGYWTGVEEPGKTRPVGLSGLTWHHAQVLDAYLPETTTEWGVRRLGATDDAWTAPSRADAAEQARRYGGTLVRREAAAWTEADR